MKRCGACGEEFQNQYKFCPVDGEVLTRRVDPDAFSYSPTIISDDSLGQRLAVQVLFLIELLRDAWSQFKSDPVAFLKGRTHQAIELFRSGSTRPYLKRALAASLTLLLLVIVSVVLLD